MVILVINDAATNVEHRN